MKLETLLEKLHYKKIRIVNMGINEKDKSEFVRNVIEGTNYVDIYGYLHRFVSKVEITIDDDCVTPVATIYI